MKVILITDVDNLGSLGDEVEVKPGYARNYLIPQGKAVPDISSTAKQLTRQKKLLAQQREQRVKESRSLGEKIAEITLEFSMKAGENGKLFGSVTSKHIQEALKEKGIELGKKELQFSGHIKTLGSHEIPVKLHTEVNSNLKVKIIADKETQEEKAKLAENAEQTESSEEKKE